MKIAKVYSHLNGHEWLLVHRKHIWDEIVSVLESIDAIKYKTKKSKEKTMKGKLLYSPKALNKVIAKKLKASRLAWKKSRTDYWVTDDFELIRKIVSLSPKQQKEEIEKSGRTAIKSYNETDFVKERVAVEVQFGKYSFIAYDLFVKHLAFYVADQIDVGIEVLPMKAMQEHMSSGPGYYEWALYDMARQGRGVPAVPLVIVGVEP
jgi:hypothetical protein